jgi:hypothetical protein
MRNGNWFSDVLGRMWKETVLASVSRFYYIAIQLCSLIIKKPLSGIVFRK